MLRDILTRIASYLCQTAAEHHIIVSSGHFLVIYLATSAIKLTDKNTAGAVQYLQ